MKKHSFTFNGPLAAIPHLLLISFSTGLAISLWNEPNFFVIILFFVTVCMMLILLYASYYRRLILNGDTAEWVRFRERRTMQVNEIKHYGIVKFRSFRFIFISGEDEYPFPNPEKPVGPGPKTFVIQYRKRAWKIIEAWLKDNRVMD